jgi:hypothetical protein
LIELLLGVLERCLLAGGLDTLQLRVQRTLCFSIHNRRPTAAKRTLLYGCCLTHWLRSLKIPQGLGLLIVHHILGVRVHVLLGGLGVKLTALELTPLIVCTKRINTCHTSYARAKANLSRWLHICSTLKSLLLHGLKPSNAFTAILLVWVGANVS